MATHAAASPATVLLEDGTAIAGSGFGASKAVGGEVVFNTGMSGYVETLTDPSYRGQILLLTYPLVGNHGVPPPRKPHSLERPFESDRIQVQGLIVQSYVACYSHHAAKRSPGRVAGSRRCACGHRYRHPVDYPATARERNHERLALARRRGTSRNTE